MLVSTVVISKRRDLSVEEKHKILKKYDSLPEMSQQEAVYKLQIPQSSLNKILNNRDSIDVEVVSNSNKSRKRKRTGKDEDIDSAIHVPTVLEPI